MKLARHEKIIELIRQYDIDTQEELAARLNQAGFKDAVNSMDTGQHLVVVKTVTGMARAVATALDALKWPEILGCIAGDDTIICACKTSEQAVSVVKKLNEIVGS